MNLSTAATADVPWAVWAIALPLGAAAAAFVSRRNLAWLGVIASLAVSATVTGLTWQVWRFGPRRYSVGGWGAPLGIDLYADGLSVLMLLMTAIIGVCVSVYAVGYFADRSAEANDDMGVAHRDNFWPLWLFLWAALNALFLSGDIFNLYVTLELITLSAVGLVTLAGSLTANAAALRYLLAALAGSLLYLLGVALLYASYGMLDIASLGRTMTPGSVSAAAIALMTVGLALKTALFPLHFWLPPAHANAPPPVSAVLSALVVKASFYLLLRLWFDAFPNVIALNAGSLLGILGAAAILWGSIQALVARRLKTLVAYSTVAQLGYLFLVFTLATPGETSTAWSGGVLFAISHACAKASMFLAVGSIQHAAGHDRIADLDGIGRQLPLTFFAVALASVSLMGLPPSGAFLAKWMLLEAALETGHVWLVVVILAGGLLAAGYLFRILGQAFTPSATAATFFVPRSMEGAALALALVALSLGLFSAPLLDLLRLGEIHVGNTAAAIMS
jgi:multicomponent Na+:H+ antiporter subunit D